jgi:ankyrin repeat protein
LTLSIDFARLDLGYTALVVAITESQIEAVEILLEHGADPNHRVADLSPLAHAAKNIDHGPEIMRLLLQCGACLKSVSGLEAMTPLHFAAMDGTPESIKFLIEKGSNIESKCRRGCTPLLLAAETGNTRTARSLLGLGANIDARSNNGGTVLSWSSCNDHTETMKLWLRSGVDIDARDRNGLSEYAFTF